MLEDHPPSLDYIIIGEGEKVCLAFHGFGQQPETMKYLSEPPEFQYKVISVALHYHGRSPSPDSSVAITPEELAQQIKIILTTENIDRFDLAGFSIGARLALSILPYFAQRIDHIWLFAPDGLPVSKTYRIATGSQVGIMLFKWFLHYAILLRILLWISCAFKLIDKKTAAYFMNELKTRSLRKRIVNTWLLYRKLIPSLEQIYQAQLREHFQISIVAGKYDKVIRGQRCIKTLNAHGVKTQFIEIEHGHNLMSTKAFRKLGEFIQERVEST